MAEMGSWNGHTFTVSPTLIRSFSGFSFNGSSNTDTTTSDGQDYVTRSSGKPIEIKLTIELNALTGSNVRSEAMAFVEQARDGAKNFFYIGTQKLMACQLMLTKADVTETKFAPNGTMISAKVALTMQQASKNDGSMAAAAPSSDGGGGGGGGSSSSKKTSVKKTAAKPTTSLIGAAVGVAVGAAAAVAASSLFKKAQATVSKVVSVAKAATKKK